MKGFTENDFLSVRLIANNIIELSKLKKTLLNGVA